MRSEPSDICIWSVLLALQFFTCRIALAGDSDKQLDWPGWRGPNMDATTTPVDIFEAGQHYNLKVVWKKPLGSGYSGVSLAEGIGVTMFSDSTYDFTLAFDPASGKELWRFKIDSTFVGRFGSMNGPISTPVISGGKVFCLGPNGQLCALDAQAGNKLWQTSLPGEHAALQPFYGFSTSPIIYENVLIVETGGKNGNAITGFDTNTGQPLWTAGSDTVEYQSPVIHSINDTDQLLCVGNRYLYGLKPDTGEMLWQYRYGGDASAIGSGSTNPLVIDNNKIFLKNKRNSSMLVELDIQGENLTPKEVWKSKQIKGTYVVPVYHHGHIFGHNGRFLTCVDTNTGESVWKSRQPGDGFPIIVDGHLVIITKKGTLSIAPASSEGFDEIASLKLFDDLVWAPPSFAYGKIYLRSMSELACVEIVGAAADVADTDKVPQGVLPGSNFARFVERVNQAEDKKAVIDEFMSTQKQFPIIEGDNMVHIIYRGDAKDLSIAGDLTGFRVEQPMNRIAGTDFFYYSSYLEPDALITYRFTKDFEQPIADTLNNKPTIRGLFGKVSVLEMPKWTASKYLSENADVAQGKIDSVVFKSDISDSTRTLKIYLPAGYEEGNTRYPVVYVHGGIGQSKIPTCLNNLIGEKVAPTMAVFIPPIFARGSYDEYIGEHKETYAEIFVKEIVPFIDATYRTIPAAQSRANVGAFWSGFMVFYSTFEYPGTFTKIGLHVPYWDPDEELKSAVLLAAKEPQQLTIYLDWGKYDLRSPLEGWDFGEYARSFARALKENGYDFSGGEVNEGFGWVSWRNRNDRLFETLFPLDAHD